MIDSRQLTSFPLATFDNLPGFTLPKLPSGFVTAWETAQSFWHFLKAFRYLRYHVAADGAVTIAHAVTGSVACFRADGNMDIRPTRNALLTSGGYVLLNCSDELDQKEFVA